MSFSSIKSFLKKTDYVSETDYLLHPPQAGGGSFTIALVIWGIVSLIHLPFDSTPDITDNQVQVITQAPSLGAQEVEQYVTTPVEMALANIPELKERRSISRSGLSVITLVLMMMQISTGYVRR